MLGCAAVLIVAASVVKVTVLTTVKLPVTMLPETVKFGAVTNPVNAGDAMLARSNTWLLVIPCALFICTILALAAVMLARKPPISTLAAATLASVEATSASPSAAIAALAAATLALMLFIAVCCVPALAVSVAIDTDWLAALAYREDWLLVSVLILTLAAVMLARSFPISTLAAATLALIEFTSLPPRAAIAALAAATLALTALICVCCVPALEANVAIDTDWLAALAYSTAKLAPCSPAFAVRPMILPWRIETLVSKLIIRALAAATLALT